MFLSHNRTNFFFLFQISANISPKWIYGAFMCPAFHFLNIQTMTVSIFTMCALAILRFLALKIPFVIKKSCITTAGNGAGLLVVSVVWILGSILAVPNTFCIRLLESGTEEGKFSMIFLFEIKFSYLEHFALFMKFTV